MNCGHVGRPQLKSYLTGGTEHIIKKMEYVIEALYLLENSIMAVLRNYIKYKYIYGYPKQFNKTYVKWVHRPYFYIKSVTYFYIKSP